MLPIPEEGDVLFEDRPAPVINRVQTLLLFLHQGFGHRDVVALDSQAKLAGLVHKLAGKGDSVICLGAGNITTWAYKLPGELKKRSAPAKRSPASKRARKKA